MSVAAGGRLGTVTVKFWEADRPSGSVAVTVTRVSPEARGVMASVPAAARVSATTPVCDVSAAQASGSPSGSAK